MAPTIRYLPVNSTFWIGLIFLIGLPVATDPEVPLLRRTAIAAVLVLALGLAACSSKSSSSGSAGSSSATRPPAPHVTLRLGYFPNLTHATALVGLKEGIFARALGPDVTLRTSSFNAGPAEVQALFAGALDAAYLGPNAAVNAFTQSNGSAIVVISGATSGGAELVVKPSITSVAQLKGTKLATPQLGNTQDVALRYWLSTKGLRTDTQGGGDVSILPQSNSTAVQAFRSGAIDGGWLPEPYATQLVQAGGHILVDERSLWPGGKFATTVLAVTKAFLRAHPDVVKALLEGQVQANDFVNKNTAQAQADAAAEIAAVAGGAPAAKVVAEAWPEMTFTDDPVASSFLADVAHAAAVGVAKSVPLTGLVDVTLLNQVLSAAGEPAVPSS
jgi:NitT/TauT family transport system substrate-binding protein